MNKTRNSLPPQVRKEAITALNQTVIELYELFTCIKQAQWNMGGLIFIQLDELANRIIGHIDRTAERAADMGGLADGLRETARLTQLKKEKEGPSAFNDTGDWIQELAGLHTRATEHVRVAIKQLIEAQDFGSADLLADVLRTLDLHLPLLEAQLKLFNRQKIKTRSTPCFTHSL